MVDHSFSEGAATAGARASFATGRISIAGVNTAPLAATVLGETGGGPARPVPDAPTTPRLGVAGNLWSIMGKGTDTLGLTDMSPRSGPQGAAAPGGKARIADRIHRTKLLNRQCAAWFLDWSYVVKKDRGRPDRVVWCDGRRAVFAPEHRTIPLFFDSGTYRIHIAQSGDVPRWAYSEDPTSPTGRRTNVELYKSAIALARPDGFAAVDVPGDRVATRRNILDLLESFPGYAAAAMWPVYPAPLAGFDGQWATRDVPGDWRRLASYADLIPLSRTQQAIAPLRRDEMVRRAIAKAVAIDKDPDFRWMADTFGRVMIGGLNKSRAAPKAEVDRPARHIVAAVLQHLNPGYQFWYLGQASATVTNGLGMLGLLDRTWLDGSWYLADSLAERFGTFEDSLITMINVGKGLGRDGLPLVQSAFLTSDMIAANLRVLFAAYRGEIQWPRIPLPIDTRDKDQVAALKHACHYAQLELGFATPG